MNPGSDSDRYFFALSPPPPIRRQLAHAARTWLGACKQPQRCTMASRYHLTVLYLGAIASAKTGLLQDLLIHLQTLRLKQFGLSLDRTGHFGSKVAWIGCTNIPPALQDLHAGLVRSTASAGIVTEQAGAFVPHVTVARDAGSRWPSSGPLQTPIRWPVHDFLLMRSMPSQQFAYRMVARFPLAPAHGD